VLVSVFGGYIAIGGRLVVLFQPFEFLIIAGAALGGFLIANPRPVLLRTVGDIRSLIKGPRYDKDSYIELLSLLYQVFKMAKTKGLLALEQHIEKPNESSLFQQFPRFYADQKALIFLCDYSGANEDQHERRAAVFGCGRVRLACMPMIGT